MSKKELAENAGVSEYDVEVILDAIGEALQERKEVEIIGFGRFYAKKRAAKKVRNPKTGEAMQMPERWVAAWKPSKQILVKQD